MRDVTSAVLVCCAVLLAACGDKVPQSDAARKLGNAPKQTIDKASGDVNRALEAGAQRSRDADAKE